MNTTAPIVAAFVPSAGEAAAAAEYDAARKATPVFAGVLSYFPDALAEVARVSATGNKQHNGSEPMRWAKEKSRDELGSLTRHLIDVARGERDDVDGLRHLAKVAWRALAALQREIERERGFDFDPETETWRKVR